jgi:Cu+-exporting ATPase
MLGRLLSNTKKFGEGGQVKNKQVGLPISGLACASCVMHVEGGLTAASGVEKATVNLANERATVETIPGTVSIADSKHAVEDVGYEALNEGDSE